MVQQIEELREQLAASQLETDHSRTSSCTEGFWSERTPDTVPVSDFLLLTPVTTTCQPPLSAGDHIGSPPFNLW